MNLYRSTFPLTLLLLLISHLAFTQSVIDAEKAMTFIKDKHVEWNLANIDIQDMSISDNYQSKNGTKHIIVQQNYRGIKIHNATINVTISPKGDIYTVGAPRFIQQIKSKINRTQPVLSPLEAIGSSLKHIEHKSTRLPELLEKNSEHSYLFSKGEISEKDIPVRLQYRINETGALRLCWLLIIKETSNSNWWELHIDAQNGTLVHQFNYTVSCRFEDHAYHHPEVCTADHSSTTIPQQKQELQKKTSAPNSYRVFPLPGESPLHTTHQIVTDPADPVASPYGWHDINGAPGADVSITFGNNVHAYQDHNSTNASSGDEPDGGSDLEFDFAYDINAGVESYTDAATVNLFYAVNMAHDFAYHHGFDEAAGNFQFINYTGAPNGFDQVIAHAQDGYLTGSVNNANFSTPADGSSGIVQMYVWDQNVGGGTKYLEVSAPSEVAGGYAATSAGLTVNGYGPPPPATPIVGEVVIAKDGKFNPYDTDACEDLINAEELMGKIALVDRGGCTFEDKTIRAEAAGAIAVIICNYEIEPEPLGGSIAPDPSIPTIMIGGPDCATLRVHAGNGLVAAIGIPSDPGPEFTDGDFDNGIIVHEYGHGISNRLTNGPISVGCLDHGEQMGEGWSDFFALAMTARAGDTGAMARGQANFVYRKGIDGRGYRNYPYSTDMAINPLTYGSMATDQEVHAVGSVWCSMIWDLYWAFVEKYDFDPNLTSGTGGNNKAVALIMEGLKQQPCLPGFVDARDAILAADLTLFNGDNQCLIWETFARRGLGYYAEQGDILSAGDGIESFASDPFCTKELQVSKEVSPKIDAGDVINVTITITNYKDETVTGVVLSDELLDGLTFLSSSSSLPGTIQGDLVVFEVGDVERGPDKKVVLTYQLATDPNKGSISQLYFDCENRDGWLVDSASDNPIDWDNSTQTPHTGSRSWRVRAIGDRTRQAIFMADRHLVTGTQPIVRFFHSHNTQAGVDGGIVQISTDEEAEIWFDQEDHFLRNKYTGALDYLTFAIPNQSGFSGNSGGFKESYIDLSAYQGQEVRLRFDLATDDDSTPPNAFWAVDDIEFMDMVNYNGMVRVTSDQGDDITTLAPNIGTVVIGTMVSTQEPTSSAISFQLYPNPVKDLLHVVMTSVAPDDVTLSLLTIDGKEVMRQKERLGSHTQNITLDVGSLSPGFYFVKATSGPTTTVRKIVIE